MSKFYISFLIFIIYSNCFSQNEANNWYFGQGAGINFNSASPTAVTNGQLFTLEGCSSISDANGNLLFYTDGRRVWNRNHTPMLNSTSPLLKGDPSSSQSGIIVPKPGSSTIYYIFTVDMQAGMALLAGDADGVSNGMMYSEVDMTLDGGLGGIVLARKNVFITRPTTEGLTAVKDASGNGYWVVTHEVNNNNYLAFRVTSSGVNTTPVVSSTGPSVTATPNFPNFGGGAAGYMKISPNGTKIAACHYRENKEVVISDFNTSTGVVSNSVSCSINLNSYSEGPYGLEFSNCSEYLYVSEDFTTFRPDSSSSYPVESRIWRFDLSASDIVASKTLFQLIPNELVAALQLAPNGKIYCSKWVRTGTNINNYSYGFGSHLHAINNPRLSTATFTNNAIALAGKFSTSGLPPFISSYFYNSSISATNIATGDSVLFCFSDSVLFRGYTSAYDSIRWYFDDLVSGINNTSTSINPRHLFAAAGTHQVQLLKYICGIADTARRTITITNYPVINDLTDLNVCSGTTVTLNATATPATSYLWNTGATTPTISTDSSGQFKVIVSNNGCISRDSMFLRETITATASVSIASANSATICQGSNTTFLAIPDASLPTNGISFSWYKNENLITTDSLISFSTNNITNGDVFKVLMTVSNAVACLSGSDTASYSFPVTVNPVPVLSSIPNLTFCDGDFTNPITFGSNLSSTTFNWTNSTPAIGLASSGTGDIASFSLTNGSLLSQNASITVTPTKNGCDGSSLTFNITVNDCTLPVELIQFDGKKIEDFTNLLFWSTASELNSKYFILEHSMNALDFSEIYKVNAAGFSNSLNEYDYTHENVSKGYNYYRLKQIDHDDKFVYSDIVTINNEAENYLVLAYPNPTAGNLSILINNPIGKSQLQLMNVLGEIIQLQEIDENTSVNLLMDLSNLANGVYYLNISDTKNKTIIPIIKQ